MDSSEGLLKVIKKLHDLIAKVKGTLIFFGAGAVGKTTLIKFLEGKTFNEYISRTEDVGREEVKLLKEIAPEVIDTPGQNFILKEVKDGKEVKDKIKDIIERELKQGKVPITLLMFSLEGYQSYMQLLENLFTLYDRKYMREGDIKDLLRTDSILDYPFVLVANKHDINSFNKEELQRISDLFGVPLFLISVKNASKGDQQEIRTIVSLFAYIEALRNLAVYCYGLIKSGITNKISKQIFSEYLKAYVTYTTFIHQTNSERIILPKKLRIFRYGGVVFDIDISTKEKAEEYVDREKLNLLISSSSNGERK